MEGGAGEDEEHEVDRVPGDFSGSMRIPSFSFFFSSVFNQVAKDLSAEQSGLLPAFFRTLGLMADRHCCT